MTAIAKYPPPFIFILLAILLVVQCTSPKADTLSLISGSWSTHIDADREYNEEHESIGLKYTDGDVSHRLFTFINSYGDRSYSYLWTHSGCEQKGDFKACLGLTFGGAIGYDFPVVPVAGPSVELGYDLVSINIMFVPVANVLTYQLEADIARF